MSTIFEKIINRELPAHIIYEDDLVIAFLDISQTTMGHTLVVPKKPYENIFSLPTELGSHLMIVSINIANAIKKAFNPLGLNLINNNGSISGQTVFHFHIHLIPRYKKEDLSIYLPNNQVDLSNEEYKRRALLIKKAL